MLLSVFSTLYELISGANPDVPDYNDEVYETVGQQSLVLIFIIIVLFYLVLGRWKPIFHKTGHWILTLVLSAVFGFAIAFLNAKDVIGDVDSYMYRFSVMNAVFSAVIFIVLSLPAKLLSIFAKRTPF